MPKLCACCSRKLPLTTYPCRCGGLYCAQHKPDAEHKCSYDYKAEFQKSLSTTMEKVIAKKVDLL